MNIGRRVLFILVCIALFFAGMVLGGRIPIRNVEGGEIYEYLKT
jgi:hypothetical protein